MAKMGDPCWLGMLIFVCDMVARKEPGPAAKRPAPSAHIRLWSDAPSARQRRNLASATSRP